MRLDREAAPRGDRDAGRRAARPRRSRTRPRPILDARDREHGAGDRGDHRQPGHRSARGRAGRRRRRGRAERGRRSRRRLRLPRRADPGGRRRAERRRRADVGPRVATIARTAVHDAATASTSTRVNAVLAGLRAPLPRLRRRPAARGAVDTVIELFGRGALSRPGLGDRGAARAAGASPTPADSPRWSTTSTHAHQRAVRASRPDLAEVEIVTLAAPRCAAGCASGAGRLAAARRRRRRGAAHARQAYFAEHRLGRRAGPPLRGAAGRASRVAGPGASSNRPSPPSSSTPAQPRRSAGGAAWSIDRRGGTADAEAIAMRRRTLEHATASRSRS